MSSSIVRKPVATLHDWTRVPVGRGLRTIERLAAGEVEPLADPQFGDQVERITTAEQRSETAERLRRIRRAA